MTRKIADLILGNWVVLVGVFCFIFHGRDERKAMKASQFSGAQKAFILKQGLDRVPMADICRKVRISEAILGSSPKTGSTSIGRRSLTACSRLRCVG